MRPLLKWAGGKRQLLPHFRRFYPEAFDRYFEPFLGSGAVFFDLCAGGRLTGRAVRLTDGNADLIGCYVAVRDDPDAVVASLERLAAGHERSGARHYYRVRQRFNDCRARAGSEGTARYTPDLAAMFIYLNRTGYNGLFRLNAGGAFNVPAGRYVRPTVCDAALIRRVSGVLSDAVLDCCPFDEAVQDARAGDFLYFDPPYEPVSPTSAFGAYTARRFSMDDQRRLCAVVTDLAARGCRVMLSNSSAPAVLKLYARAVAGRPGGLALWRIPARRSINSRGTGRGPVAELLLTNQEPQPGQAVTPLVRVA